MCENRWALSDLLSSPLCIVGQFDAERLSSDLSIRRRPGCDQRSSQQRGPAADGEGGQGASQTGAGQPHGRLEVLHLLRLLGVSSINAEPGLAGGEVVIWTQESALPMPLNLAGQDILFPSSV